MGQTQNLNAAFETGDQAKILAAILAVIMDTGNVKAFALKAGMDRTNFYRLPNYNPKFDFVLKTLDAAGFELRVVDHPKIRSKQSMICKQLARAFDSGDIEQIVNAFSEILHALKNVSLFAQKVNLHRGTLYKAFTAPRIPSVRTALSVLNALDLRLAVSRVK
jgi:DNA-binding phage protein